MFGKRKVVAAAIADEDTVNAPAPQDTPPAPQPEAKPAPTKPAPSKTPKPTKPPATKPAKQPKQDAGPKPMRGQTAYFLFMAERRPQLRSTQSLANIAPLMHHNSGAPRPQAARHHPHAERRVEGADRGGKAAVQGRRCSRCAARQGRQRGGGHHGQDGAQVCRPQAQGLQAARWCAWLIRACCPPPVLQKTSHLPSPRRPPSDSTSWLLRRRTAPATTSGSVRRATGTRIPPRPFSQRPSRARCGGGV